MEEFKYIISQDEINLLPIGAFEGNIHLIENPEEAEKAAESLMSLSEAGFDTESRPSFKKGQHFSISLIQISSCGRKTFEISSTKSVRKKRVGP